MTYLRALQLLINGYKKVKGRMPEGLDLLKIKQEARQKVINAKKIINVDFSKGRKFYEEGIGDLIQKGKLFVGKAPKTKKIKEAVDPKLVQQESIKDMYKRLMRSNKEAIKNFKNRNKPRDDKATGGLANLSQTYDNNPTLQSQFPDKQDYLDLFSSTTTTTPQTQTYAQMTQQSPAGIPAVKPIVPIIPQGDSGDGGGGITSNKRNKNFDYETEAYGINPTGLSKDVFDYEYAAANANKGIFETLKQFSPTYQFMKAGKKLKDAGQQAIKDYFAKKEAEKIAAAQLIAQQNIQQGSSGGPGEGAGTFGASINEATGARGSGTGFSDYT